MSERNSLPDGNTVLPAPAPIRVNLPGGGASTHPDDQFPAEVEMTLVDHLEELRRRILRSLLAVVIGAAGCLLLVKPLVRLLEVPAQGIHFLQLAPGEFLFVSLKVAGYSGLTLALPYVLYEGLSFVLPGLTRREQRLVAPAVGGLSRAVSGRPGLRLVGPGAGRAQLPGELRRGCGGAALVDRALPRFRAAADGGHGPGLPAAGAADAAGGPGASCGPKPCSSAWRFVVVASALAGAVLTPSTDPVTMLLLSGAITALYLVGVGLARVVQRA